MIIAKTIGTVPKGETVVVSYFANTCMIGFDRIQGYADINYIELGESIEPENFIFGIRIIHEGSKKSFAARNAQDLMYRTMDPEGNFYLDGDPKEVITGKWDERSADAFERLMKDTIADQGLTVPKGTDLRRIYNPTRHILYRLYSNSGFDLLGDDTR